MRNFVFLVLLGTAVASLTLDDEYLPQFSPQSAYEDLHSLSHLHPAAETVSSVDRLVGEAHLDHFAALEHALDTKGGVEDPARYEADLARRTQELAHEDTLGWLARQKQPAVHKEEETLEHLHRDMMESRSHLHHDEEEALADRHELAHAAEEHQQALRVILLRRRQLERVREMMKRFQDKGVPAPTNLEALEREQIARVRIAEKTASELSSRVARLQIAVEDAPKRLQAEMAHREHLARAEAEAQDALHTLRSQQQPYFAAVRADAREIEAHLQPELAFTRHEGKPAVREQVAHLLEKARQGGQQQQQVKRDLRQARDLSDLGRVAFGHLGVISTQTKKAASETEEDLEGDAMLSEDVLNVLRGGPLPSVPSSSSPNSNTSSSAVMANSNEELDVCLREAQALRIKADADAKVRTRKLMSIGFALDQLDRYQRLSRKLAAADDYQDRLALRAKEQAAKAVVAAKVAKKASAVAAKAIKVAKAKSAKVSQSSSRRTKAAAKKAIRTAKIAKAKADAAAEAAKEQKSKAIAAVKKAKVAKKKEEKQKKRVAKEKKVIKGLKKNPSKGLKKISKTLKKKLRKSIKKNSKKRGSKSKRAKKNKKNKKTAKKNKKRSKRGKKNKKNKKTTKKSKTSKSRRRRRRRRNNKGKKPRVSALVQQHLDENDLEEMEDPSNDFVLDTTLEMLEIDPKTAEENGPDYIQRLLVGMGMQLKRESEAEREQVKAAFTHCQQEFCAQAASGQVAEIETRHSAHSSASGRALSLQKKLAAASSEMADARNFFENERKGIKERIVGVREGLLVLKKLVEHVDRLQGEAGGSEVVEDDTDDSDLMTSLEVMAARHPLANQLLHEMTSDSPDLSAVRLMLSKLREALVNEEKQSIRALRAKSEGLKRQSQHLGALRQLHEQAAAEAKNAAEALNDSQSRAAAVQSKCDAARALEL